MNASPLPPHSSTTTRTPSHAVQAADALDEEDFALGWECANPALQIELWGSEAVAQPLENAY